MLHQARKANAVVTNPEHLACAIRYDPNEEGYAPRLIREGKNFMASGSGEIAKEEKDIENRPRRSTLGQHALSPWSWTRRCPRSSSTRWPKGSEWSRPS